MWQARSEPLAIGVGRVQVLRAGRPVSYAAVLGWWREDAGFRSWFCETLAAAPFEAYFWETPPVTFATREREFECVLVDAPALVPLAADPGPFRRRFGECSQPGAVLTFPNLGGDAVLVVPCPSGPSSAYPHLAAFLRLGPADQKHLLWQSVAVALKRRLGEQPVWLSTSGLGVAWLHLRLDSHPKYYQFTPYRTAFV